MSDEQALPIFRQSYTPKTRVYHFALPDCVTDDKMFELVLLRGQHYDALARDVEGLRTKLAETEELLAAQVPQYYKHYLDLERQLAEAQQRLAAVEFRQFHADRMIQ